MGMLNKIRVKDDPNMVFEDSLRRMKIQTNFMKYLGTIAPIANLYDEKGRDKTLKDWYKKRFAVGSAWDALTFELIYYPFTEEESKNMGSHFEKLYKDSIKAKETSLTFGLINSAYFYLRDKYGLVALNEPKGTDLSYCLPMYFYGRYIDTLTTIFSDPALREQYNPADKPVALAADWGAEYVFSEDAKFRPDFEKIRDFRNKYINEHTVTKSVIKAQNLARKKMKEYNKDIKGATFNPIPNEVKDIQDMFSKE